MNISVHPGNLVSRFVSFPLTTGDIIIQVPPRPATPPTWLGQMKVEILHKKNSNQIFGYLIFMASRHA